MTFDTLMTQCVFLFEVLGEYTALFGVSVSDRSLWCSKLKLDMACYLIPASLAG